MGAGARSGRWGPEREGHRGGTGIPRDFEGDRASPPSGWRLPMEPGVRDSQERLRNNHIRREGVRVLALKRDSECPQANNPPAPAHNNRFASNRGEIRNSSASPPMRAPGPVPIPGRGQGNATSWTHSIYPSTEGPPPRCRCRATHAYPLFKTAEGRMPAKRARNPASPPILLAVRRTASAPVRTRPSPSTETRASGKEARISSVRADSKSSPLRG